MEDKYGDYYRIEIGAKKKRQVFPDFVQKKFDAWKGERDRRSALVKQEMLKQEPRFAKMAAERKLRKIYVPKKHKQFSTGKWTTDTNKSVGGNLLRNLDDMNWGKKEKR